MMVRSSRSLCLISALLAATAASPTSGSPAATAAAKPHVVFLLIDDYGWANAGWHNDAESGGQREVQTPHMDELVATGINLNQHYTFKFCSPTRSALQSGRNPIHVNVQNVGPDLSNPDDPVAGFSAIARNMTGMAAHMRAAGYKTAAVGKWDAGMATADHTPKGRGYDQSLVYFHHANDYWTYQTGTCKPGTGGDGAAPPAAPPHVLTPQERRELNLPSACPATFNIVPETGVCKDSSREIWHGPVADQDECCARCAAAPGCVGWTHQYRSPQGKNTSTCFVCNGTKGGPTPGRTSGCAGAACDLSAHGVTDLWKDDAGAVSLKPAPGCVAQTSNTSAPWPANSSCVYEDALFEAEVQRIVAEHPLPQPLFLFWAPHIVHGPAQLPEAAFEALDFIGKAGGPGSRGRQNYLARVHYIDAAFGRLVAQLKERGMYNDTVIVMSADNGGPLGSANNFPLKGGKHSNWQGGVRVNAFVSGGALPAPVRGTTYDELVTVWDWYATFVEGIAGADASDHRAAAAGLPPIDSINHWDHLTGRSSAPPPRDHIPLGSCADAPDKDAFCQAKGHQQTTVNAVVAYLGAGEHRTLWKLLVGRIPLAGWTGPKYPNGTGASTPTIGCGTPGGGGSGTGCLYNLDADPTEHNNLGGDERYASVAAQLFAMIQQHNATTFSPDRGSVDPAACAAARGSHGSFWGPWIR